MRRRLLSAFFLVVLSAGHAFAQEDATEPAAQPQGGDDLRASVQNPISSLISLPLQFRFDYGAPNGEASFLNIQPVFPVTVGDWNLVSRFIVPLIDSPGEVAGTPAIPTPVEGNGAVGLGDINYSLFFSPVKYDKVIWGIGPSIGAPTATDDQLGSDKWSAGPSAVALMIRGPWVVGVLANNLWSYAGDDDREDVNQFLLQYFINYNLPQGWYISSAPIITANWEADSGDKWTVPFGGGVGKIFRIGKQPMNAQVQAFYNVEKPDNGPDWTLRLQLQFLFPQ